MSALSIVAIIPLYNGARWIEGSIQSVLNQTLPPDEFIVVDDGSTDDGPAIVETLAATHPIRLLRKANGGQGSARNYGVAHSSSHLIALLDQDDGWYPNHLAELIKPFRKTYSLPLGWTYSDLDLVTESGDMYARNFLSDMQIEQPKRHLTRCLSENMHVLPSASLISREAFEQVGGFDERLRGYEDDDLFLRIFGHWHNVYVPLSLSYWRMNNNSASFSPTMAKSRMIYARKCIDAFPDDRKRNVFLVRDFTAPKFFRHAAVDYMKAAGDGDNTLAMRALTDMEEMAPYLKLKLRMAFRLAWPILVFPSIARLMLPLAVALGARRLC